MAETVYSILSKIFVDLSKVLPQTIKELFIIAELLLSGKSLEDD